MRAGGGGWRRCDPDAKPATRRVRRTSPSPFTPSWTPRPAQFGHGCAPQRRGADERRRRAARRHPLPDGARDRAARRRAVPGAVVHDALRQEGPAAGRPDRRWRHPVSDQARLHRGDGRRPRQRRVRRFLRDVRGAADPGRDRAGRVGVEAAERQRTCRHVRDLLPGDQPAVHRRRRRAGFAAEGDFPGDGRPRFLSRRGGHGRGSAPAHGTGLRGGLPLAQRRQPGAGGDQPRQASAAAGRRVRRGAAAWARSARVLPAVDRRRRRRR